MPEKIRARIQIKDSIQDVGFRSIVTAILIENGIERANLINDRDDKKVVNIFLEENEETLNNLKGILKIEIENSRDEIPHLPEHFIVSDWERVNSNPPTLLKLSDLGSDALQLRQMSKFVGVGDRMASGMEKMNETQGHMAEETKGMRGDIATMTSTMTDWSNDFKNFVWPAKKK